MPWARTDVGEQRVKFVVRAASGKERMAALCREFGISRTTGYRWRRRFEQGRSFTAVVERSRRPKHSPSQTEPRKEERVVELRRENGWGAKKIDVLLREKKTALTVTTINRILKRRGLVGMKDSHPPALERFERAAPNELWQMDGKGEYRASDGTCYPLSILDDHSRYAVGLVFVAGVHGRVGASLPGERVRALRGAGSDADGSRVGVVGHDEWLRTDVAFGALDRARHPAVLRARASSADAGESGTLPSHAERSDAASREAAADGGVAGRAGGISADLQRAAAARSAGNETAGGTISCESARLPGGTARVGISGGQRGAAAERGGLFILERADVVRVRSTGGTVGAGRERGKSSGSELPAHVRAGDRPEARMHAGAGDVARCWQGSPVALRAPYEPCQHRKPGVRSVTDVLTHGVTHVLRHRTASRRPYGRIGDGNGNRVRY